MPSATAQHPPAAVRPARETAPRARREREDVQRARTQGTGGPRAVACRYRCRGRQVHDVRGDVVEVLLRRGCVRRDHAAVGRGAHRVAHLILALGDRVLDLLHRPALQAGRVGREVARVDHLRVARIEQTELLLQEEAAALKRLRHVEQARRRLRAIGRVAVDAEAGLRRQVAAVDAPRSPPPVGIGISRVHDVRRDAGVCRCR